MHINSGGRIQHVALSRFQNGYETTMVTGSLSPRTTGPITALACADVTGKFPPRGVPCDTPRDNQVLEPYLVMSPGLDLSCPYRPRFVRAHIPSTWLLNNVYFKGGTSGRHIVLMLKTTSRYFGSI